MKLSTFVTVASAALPELVSAHYFFPHLYVNDVRSQEFEFVRRSTQGFQPHFGFDILSSNDFRCNTGATTNDGTKVASVAAGDTIGFGTNLEAQIQHPGPVIVYFKDGTFARYVPADAACVSTAGLPVISTELTNAENAVREKSPDANDLYN